jgi:photosystem II stability/assembly factor-like uncharacterized protein
MEDAMRHGRFAAHAAVICSLLSAQSADAQSLRAPAPGSRLQPTPEQDDATLHDVTFVGSRIGYAVGERGVVWKTEDGGRSWRLLPAPVECSLRSVCFLTDRIGWIVGGATTPYVHTAWGVVLFTDDGGEKWQLLADKTVPWLHDVQFFGLERGIAIGEASARFPNGVLTTEDGGRTWLPMPGEAIRGQRTASFIDESTGFVGGPRGAAATIGGGQLLPAAGARFGLRGVNGIELQPDGSGWLVGDGGLMLFSDSGGVRWSEPAAALPRDLADFVDFQAVSTVGSHVWAAGAPGSVVWHSADAGRHWERQFTADAGPIHALDFSSESHGCAVGPFGKVLITTDGGATWRAVRGGGRRVALLSILGDARELSAALVTRVAGEEGYRLGAAVIARGDVGPDGHAAEHLDLYLQDALVSAGGCDSRIDWRLPVAAPGLQTDYRQLVAQWRLLTDGRLPEVMLGSLVASLRTWRPDVVIVEQPDENNAVDRLVHDAVLQAVRYAGDPTRYPEQFDPCGLTPWQVNRVFVRLPSGTAGTVELDPYQILPRQQQTLALQAAASAARLPGSTGDVHREGYGLEWSSEQLQELPAEVHGFFTGLNLRAGGAARRDLPPITELDFDRLEELARHERNFEGYTERMLDDPRHAGQIIAQLDDVIGRAPANQAARLLWQLAVEYQRRSQWDLAEAALLELVQNYPREPISLEGMDWLLTFWTSQEMTWQRVRKQSAGSASMSVDGNVVQSNLDEFQQRLQQGVSLDELRSQIRSQSSPLTIEPAGGFQEQRFQTQQRQLDASRWLEQAARLAGQLQRIAPEFFADPGVQFVNAALSRRRARYEISDAVYREFAILGNGPWQLAGRGEIWALGAPAESPKPVLGCRQARQPPYLDGLLGDPIWQEAQEVRLRRSDDEAATDGFVGNRGFSNHDGPPGTRFDNAPRTLVMLAYDDEYLYLAASVPRQAGLPTDPTGYPGRTHDEDLSGFDQLSLQIDVDRDYATFYRFDVDSRAHTRDACWVDQRYDPQWYVAADSDERRWTVEAAIPLVELVPASPMPGDIWAVGITRTLPTIGVEGWTTPVSSIPRPALFGFLRFE